MHYICLLYGSVRIHSAKNITPPQIFLNKNKKFISSHTWKMQAWMTSGADIIGTCPSTYLSLCSKSLRVFIWLWEQDQPYKGQGRSVKGLISLKAARKQRTGELVKNFSSFIAPQRGWLWHMSNTASQDPQWDWAPVGHNINMLKKASLMVFFHFSVSFPHPLTSISEFTSQINYLLSTWEHCFNIWTATLTPPDIALSWCPNQVSIRHSTT